MEQRLAEFRARKAKIQTKPVESNSGEGGTGSGPRTKTLIQKAKDQILSACNKWRNPEPAAQAMSQARTEVLSVMAGEAEPVDSSMWKVVLLLKVLLWLALLGLFVELEFGLAYFLLSMFYWLYEGTRRPGRRKEGEKSAYSVFNPGCEAIQGTLTAEQFERELQYRPLAGT
ncbi:hypothetical protein GDO81_019205 [Engystomops pustulosus]|uniref:SAYSvFN domain-containing protein n=1 Tax=Engystomops pustulosus TaxID=76066 RepID=A0AAV6ZAX1_ENGPU|nr:hypothetical protein GDO81_019205 [Engystomops pustulosus]